MGTNLKIGDAPHLEALFPNQQFLSAWSTPEAFSRHIEGIDGRQAWHTSAWKETNGHFYGTKNLAEALKMGKEGWKEGADQVYRLRDRILAKHPLIKRPVQYGIVGAVPNIARAVAGNIMNMRIPDSAVSKRRPVITLISDMSAHRGIDKDAISNRAAAVVTIIDQIESKGFACEVLSTALTKAGYGRESGHKCTNVIVVKESSQPVDVARIAFSLGHTAFFRRLVFADWGGHKHNEPLSDGLGHTYEFKVKEYNHKGYFVLPSAEKQPGCFESEEATETQGLPYLVYELKKQGCPAFPLTIEEKHAMMNVPPAREIDF